nr:energy-coupling factor transporter transmembrane component T [Candidatus Calescibacterium sp.]
MFRQVIMFASSSKGRIIHPVEKMLLVFFPVLFLGFTKNPLLLAANIALFLLLHWLFQTPWPWVLRYVFTLLGFAGSSSALLLFDYPFTFALVALLRATFSSLALTLFLFTTPPGDVFLFLARFPTLRDVCTIAQGMEHFILTLEEEFYHLVRSIRLRGGFRTWRLAAQNSGKIGALLFKNALSHYERTKEALEARLFRGIIPRSEEPYAFSKARCVGITVYLISLVCALWLIQ